MLDFLYIPVSWVLLRWHALFTAMGLNPSSGVNWALSIVFLVVTARLLLFRLFIKQVKYQRHMQEMQPKITALREKYKSDRAEMQRQMMQLQQEQGFNPLTGCLPMFAQIPIFIALFHVLRHMSNSVVKCGNDLHSKYLTLYTFTETQTCDAAKSKLWDAPLAASLHDANHTITLLGGDPNSTRVVTVVLVLVSAVATFFTQRLALSRSTTVATGTAATVQNLMKVFIPISVLFSGLIFPLGVLLYWFTSNTWTLLQQLYINKYHPATPKDTPEVGALGKTLAPRPGQRPTRGPINLDKGPSDKTNDTTPTDPTGAGPAGKNGATPAADPPRGAPRPGQRPSSPGGNRPPAKRPNKKKRR